MEHPDFDLTDDDLRRAGNMKWAAAPPGVLPAWVAEMDVRPVPAVLAALHDAVERGTFGYPPHPAADLQEATAALFTERFGLAVDPAHVVATGDVMAGVMLALQALCEPAPVVVPVPTYPPFLAAVPLTGRAVVTVPCLTGEGGRPELDLDGIGSALAAGARTILLANPHNPLGRAWTAAELGGLRDVADRYGARVVSDEVHAPLVLPGAVHVPYAAVAPERVTTVFSASKAWNVPGLKCAQIIAGTAEDLSTLRALPPVANHGTSPLGIVATVAAYRDGGPWLDGLVAELAGRREQFAHLMAQRLPGVRLYLPEATYLVWADLRETGPADPAGAALSRGRVWLDAGRRFGPGYESFARINLATSAERLERIVDGLVTAWPEAAA